MYGLGLAKGLMVTMRHFVETYVDDIRYGFRKYSADNNFEVRQGTEAKGAFTVQYPDEKVAVPERYRFVPFLVVEDDDHPERAGSDWCTSCGICAKVCPPQCIWIVRSNDPDTGRPVPEPEAFFIDTDICMNCGFCAEYCPFDAIKMDHDYELASFDRTTHHIHDKERLSKPLSYWVSIAPTRAYEEAQARGAWEHKDFLKEIRRGKRKVELPDPENLPSYEVLREQRRETSKKQAAEAAKQAEAEAKKPKAEAEAKPKAEAKSEKKSGGLDMGDEEARRKRRERALKRKAERAKKRDQRG